MRSISRFSLLLFYIISLLSKTNFAQKNQNTDKKYEDSKWNTCIEESHKIFIENKGQFDNQIKNEGETAPVISYGVDFNGVNIYFTSSGITYRHNEIVKIKTEWEGDEMNEDEKEKEENNNTLLLPKFLEMKWVGANSNAQIIGVEEADNYFTYSILEGHSEKTTVKAAAYKKLIYKNIYPNIDVEYIFPKDKPGIKYNIILHPGADAKKIKMRYEGAKDIQTDAEGNISITSSFGQFTDHAPVTYYEQGEKIKSFFLVSRNIVSFNLAATTSKKTIIIDPWTTVPVFAGANKAYDIDWDYQGNIYVYGGQAWTPYQLMKLNSAGAVQWTYSNIYFDNRYYDDFAMDRNDGTAYICAGVGASLLKVNTLGFPVALKPWNHMIGEYWRIVFNSCTRQGVLGGGSQKIGGAPQIQPQAATFDTSLNITQVNVLGTDEGFHDVSLLAMDDTNCYMAFAVVPSRPSFDNVFIKAPVATLFPTAYILPEGHKFQELNISYTGGQSNGFNGMAKNANYLYTYDGATLKKWNPWSGAFINSVTVSTDTFKCGGIAVDACDNVYVGTLNGVKKYGQSLNFVASTATTGKVYDVTIGTGGEVFACGDGFVSALSLFACSSLYSYTLSTSSTPATCLGNDGTASVSITGGNAPFSYLWSPGGQNASTATGLAPGKYQVTVFERNGESCNNSIVNTATVSVISASGFTQQSHTATNVTCYGEANGTASFTVSGGNLPVTYSWLPGGQTTALITGLSSGKYTVKVNDNTGCQTIDSVTIASPSGITIHTVKYDSIINCHGGSIVLDVNGGTPSYNYSWSTGAVSDFIWLNTNGTFSLTVTYTVLVTDANGCSLKTSFPVHRNADPPWYLSIADIGHFCNGNNGSIKVEASIPASSFYIHWGDSEGDDVDGDTLVNNLSPDTYTGYFEDISGCRDTTIFVTIKSFTLTGSATSSDLSCNNIPDGSVTVAATGVAPFSYLWNTIPAQTSNPITGLSAGTYICMVTDSAGCLMTNTVTITQPAVLSVTTTISSPLCYGGSGSATTNETGGTPPYFYLWSNGQTTPSATGLSAGNYTLTLNDSNGCILTTTLIITQPYILSISTSESNPLCNGGNGSGIAGGTGGTSPYHYYWSNGETTQITTSLIAGTYTVTITDNNNCVITTTVTITEPAPFAIITNITDAICNGSLGSATVTISGSSSPYSFLWNNGETKNIVTNLTAGTHTLIITYNNDCVQTTLVSISQPESISLNTTSNPTACIVPTGIATATINSGGVAPFSYNWSSGHTTQTITGLAAGNYTITVTDANGCTQLQMIAITQVPPLPISINATLTTITSGDSIQLNVSGGGTYQWEPSTGLSCISCSSPNAGPVITTNYCVEVTDINGCKDTACITIIVEVPCGEIFIPDVFSPNNDGQNDLECIFGSCIDQVHLSIYDRWGNKVFETTDPKACWNGTYKGKSMSTGIFAYYLEVILLKGAKITKKGNISLIK